jgi:hypothetical protein
MIAVVILAAVLAAGFLGLTVPHVLNTLGLAAADCDNC